MPILLRLRKQLGLEVCLLRYRGSRGFLINADARASVMFFFQKIYKFFLFKVTKSHQKAMSKIRTIVCCSKYYQNDFRY